MNKKLLIAGLGRHGKDTACDILFDFFGLSFESSSWAAADEFIFNKLKDSHGYRSVAECFEDRHTGENRKLWFDLITEYNKDDPARLAKIITSRHDVYCGLRSIVELEECRKQGVFDLVIWIDATERLGITETIDSIDITKEDCDIIIENNGTEADLFFKIMKLGKILSQ